MKRGRPPQDTTNDNAPRSKQQKTTVPATSSSTNTTSTVVIKQTPDRQYKQLKVEDALAYLDQVKLKFKDQPNIYDRFLDIMKDFKAQTIDTPGVIARVSELFKGHDNLVLGFNTFLPPGYKIEMHHFTPQDKKERERIEATMKNKQQQTIDFDQAISYVTKIKSRFNDQPDTYKAFLDILHTYQKEQTTIRKVYEQVAILFKDHADLLAEFTHFLPETPADARATKTKGKKKSEIGGTRKSKRVSNKKKGEEEEEFQYENRREYSQANIAKYGPSYRSLPKNYPQPQCSERSELCNEVLNDELVSVPAGSEESRGDNYKKSVFDEIIFQCEDDRTEVDIVIEQNLSTIQFLEPLAQKIESDANAKFDLDQLRDIHRASISRIYADKANDVLEGLRKNPTTAIPVILARLKQKDEEWKQARKGLNKFWHEIYEKNYQKAMEEQCTNFKTLDKKNLNAKKVLADIEERHTYNKEITVDVSDEYIHHIIFGLLSSVSELTEKELENMRIFWKDVIIPFFGLKALNPSDELLIDDKTGEKFPIQSVSELIAQPVKEDPEFQPLIEKDLAKKPAKHLLFGNVPMVLFMRYYVYLFERIKRARDLAERQMRNLHKPVPTAEIIKEHDAILQGGAEESVEKKKAPKEETLPYFSLFIKTLVQFFTDKLEPTEFEEELKNLLGNQSYFMFTVDALFTGLQQQLRNIFGSMRQDLINAFKYEHQRVNSFLDNSYYIQAHKILGNGPCYVFDYHLDSKRLVLDIVEPPELDPEKIEAEEKGLEYVQHYLSTTRVELEKTNRIFLNRTKKIKDPVANTIVQNNLEYKICIATFKMFYVEDTSDLLYRKKDKKNTLEGLRKKQVERFDSWFKTRQAEMDKEDTSKMDLDNDLNPNA
jgi:paired amphipathic helix protein Sin3a